MKHYLIYLHGLWHCLKHSWIGDKSLNSFSVSVLTIQRSLWLQEHPNSHSVCAHFSINILVRIINYLFKKYSI